MYPVAVISPPTIFPIHCLTKSAQFSNLLSLVHWDFMAPISRLHHLIRAQCSDCWKDSRHFHDSFSFLHREAGEERMRNSMLFSTCFKAVRCFLHNQLSSRTHTTGLNLFFSATTIPRWWSAILMFETIFSFSPSKADATTFKEGYIMTLSLCQTGHYSRTFLLSFGGLSKLIGQRKLAWKPTIGAFHVFFFEIFHNH